MTNGSAAGAAAAQAARMNAIKASGVLIRVESRDFRTIVEYAKEPLVVVAPKGFWNRQYRYLTSYKGLAFYTKSPEPLMLPGDTELIKCESFSIPT